MLPQRGVLMEKDDPLPLYFLVDLVVHDLGFVLSSTPGDEPLALRFRNAEFLVGVLDVFREILPGLCLFLSGAHEVLDVVEVDLTEVGPPCRHGFALKQLQRPKAALEHPLRLVFECRDVAHDTVGEPALGTRTGGVRGRPTRPLPSPTPPPPTLHKKPPHK